MDSDDNDLIGEGVMNITLFAYYDVLSHEETIRDVY